MEQPKADDTSPPPDETPGYEPAPSRKPKVTPLDDDKNIKDGIEVNET